MMMQFFSGRTIPATAFLSLCLLIMLSVAFGCQQDKKNTVPPAATETTTAPPPVITEAPAPKEDYSLVIMEVSKKEYEPLGRKILANHEKLQALNTGEANDYGKRQSQLEADFVENMKMLDYLAEKENSKEMSKEQSTKEKQQILQKIKGIEAATNDLGATLQSNISPKSDRPTKSDKNLTY